MVIREKNKFKICVDPVQPKAETAIGDVFSVFDHVYCIHYLPYADRLEAMKKELEFVGLTDNPKFSWYFTGPNKYYDLLFYGDVSKIDPSVNITNINYTVNSYNLMKLAYDLGHERILILEDDIRFLKDRAEIAEFMRSMPLDYDLVMFEYFIWSKTGDQRSVYDTLRPVNDRYLEFNQQTIFDTGMFSLSRRMIRHILDGDEQLLRPFDGYTRFQNTGDDREIRRAVSRVPLCVQREYALRQEETDRIDKYSMFDKEAYRD